MITEKLPRQISTQKKKQFWNIILSILLSKPLNLIEKTTSNLYI